MALWNILLGVLLARILWLLICYPWRRKQAGALVLALDRSKIDFFVGLSCLLLGLLFALQWLRTAAHDVERLIAALALISLGIDNMIRRLEIRENGIMNGVSLLQWRSVASYEWRSENDEALLVLRLKNKFLRRDVQQYLTPSTHREAVDRQLKRHLNGEAT